MDYLKELAIQTGGKIRSLNGFSSNFKEKTFRSLSIKDFKQYKVEIYDFGSLCSIAIRISTEAAFAINNPDRVLYYDIPVSLDAIPYTIYVSDSNIDLVEKIYFHKACEALKHFLMQINIMPEESVFVTRDAIVFAFKTDRNLILILEGIVELLNTNDEIFKRTVRNVFLIKNIPEQLRPLVPLIKKYGIPDDTEREQLIEGMKTNKKKQLIETVSPYMSEINKFLDSFKEDPLSEEATRVGNLAELVTELMINT